MKTKYELCKNETINSILKKYEEGQLKDRSNKKIMSRKQAIAIALSISDKECEKKISINDLKKMEDKFHKNIYDIKENHKISDKKLTYTTVKNGFKLIDYYSTKNKNKKSSQIYHAILSKILIEIQNGNKINQTIIQDFFPKFLNFLE